MATLKNTTIGTNLILPSGSLAQRPSSLTAGMLRHNSTLNTFEYYNGSSWIIYHSGVVASGGNDIYDFGPFRIHVFTGSGTFTATATGSIDVLLVAGGGGGGAHVPGGGGAGGLIYRPGLEVTVQGYPIVIGNGGTGSYNNGSYAGMPNSTAGGDTTGFGLTAKGGGIGSSWTQDQRSRDGGSGGGANINRGAGGAATQLIQAGDSGTFGFGNAGASSLQSGSAPYPAGGGGGAGGPGTPGPILQRSGDGGPGRYYGDKFGTKYGEIGWFAGGGGGGAWGFTSNGRGFGGQGGGGDGDSPTDAGSGTGPSSRFSINEPTGESGGANTGGGGGGAGRNGGESSRGGGGGSGIVMIRYLR